MSLIRGDARFLPLVDGCVDAVVTSPPYFGLRDYGHAGQIGLEQTPDAYVSALVDVFRDVRRVLKADGVVFLNLGDSYFGSTMTGGNNGINASGGADGFKMQRQFAKPAGARRVVAYGNSGKAPEGSTDRDCLCGSLCGACRVAYQTGRSHSDGLRDATPSLSPSVTSRERMVFPSGHPATSDSLPPAGHSAIAIPGAAPSQALSGARLLASPESMIAESFQPLQAGSRLSDQPSVCRLCGCSLAGYGQVSVDSLACTCGTVSQSAPSIRRTSGIASSDSAHQYSTSDSLKAKDLIGIPWRVAFALQADGWYLRSDVIWCLSGGAKVYARTQKGDMPMSVKDLVRLDPATVQLWNGAKWTQVLGWSRSPDPRDGALELELRSGERIGCTPGHEWPTQRGNVRTDALVPGDVIQTTTLPEPDAPVDAGALDDDVAWFCGLYLAEGSMSGNTVQIAGHVDQTDGRMTRLESLARRFHGTIRCHTSQGQAASICLDGPIIASIVRAYIHGDDAGSKGLKPRAWQRSTDWLRNLLDGYLAGDGHYDGDNRRWRLGFTRNDRLASDLRTLAARCGASIRLAPCTVSGFGREWPAYRGDLRLVPSAHHNARCDGEVVAIRPVRGRQFWDIGVEDEPHLFALASGVLTHNSKPNPMPESVTDRPTKAHEYLFLLAKSERYHFNADAIAEPISQQSMDRYARVERNGESYDPQRHKHGDSSMHNAPMEVLTRAAKRVVERGVRNKRTVWTIPTMPYAGAHFATMPEKLVEPCILAGCPIGGLVLDPFVGSGTVVAVAERLGRRGVGVDLSYQDLSRKRTAQRGLRFTEPSEVIPPSVKLDRGGLEWEP